LDIASALQQASWNVAEPQALLKMPEGPVALGTNPPLKTGVIIVNTENEASRHAADAVLHELLALGFDATKRIQVDQHHGPIVFINVEHRPEGAQGEARLRALKSRTK
jgi:hypothetical protein